MSDRFLNEPVTVDGLPRLDEQAFVSVDPRYVWGTLAGVALALVGAVAGTTFWVANTDAVAVPIGLGVIAGVVLLTVGVMSWLEARRLAYQLRDHDLSLRSGVVSRAVETIPFSRVQHVSVGRGPIERALGLATLTVSSAGPDISVFGLTPDDADRIKQLIAERAGVDADDAASSIPGASVDVASSPPSLPPPVPPPSSP